MKELSQKLSSEEKAKIMENWNSSQEIKIENEGTQNEQFEKMVLQYLKHMPDAR